MSDTLNGTVKWFNNQKGYGFISGEDGNEYFVHFTGIAGNGFRELVENQKVEFNVEDGDKGQKAVNVTVVE
jgi:CspA family cold shock protein